MKIKKLEITNFRGFNGEHEIELSVDDEKSLTLIIAENGTGKTGFLEAIMWCLHGVLPEGSDEVTKIVNMHARKKNPRANAEVRLTVLDDLSRKANKKPEYVISRILKPGESETKPLAWQRDRTKRGGLSQISSPDQLIESLLPKRLSPYFLFRGEGIKEWFKEEDETTLKRSIEDMQGLSFARKALVYLEEYSEELSRKLIKSDKATFDQKKAMSKLDELKNDKDDIIDNQKSIQAELKDVKKKLKIVFETINNSDHELIKEKNKQNLKLGKDLISYGTRRDRLIKEKRHILHDNAFSVLTFDIKDDLSSFFSESRRKNIIPAPYDEITLTNVLEEGVCICGRPITEHSPEEEYIKASFEEAGSEDQTSRKNSIENLFLEYSWRNKNTRELYEKKETEIIETEKIIQENEQLISDNLEDIKGAEKDKNIGKLLSQQEQYQSDRDGLLVKDAQISYGLKDLEKNIKTQLDVIKRVSIGGVDSSVQKKMQFVDKCTEKLTQEIQRLSVEGRVQLGQKLQEICEEFNRKGESFEFINKDSYVPRIKDGDDYFLPQNDGTSVQTAIYYALGLINVCIERQKLSGTIVEPGTIAPMVCDAVFSALDPVNTGSVTQMLATIPKQTILLINSGSYDGPCRDELIKSNKIGKAYYLQRKQKKIIKDLSTMLVNGKKYQAFVKSDEISGTIQKLSNY